MDPISSSGLPTNGAYGQVTPPPSTMDMQTFLQLLTVQLANQNPLDPMSDADFYSQISSLGQVQGLDKLTSASEMGQAASMIGKRVTALETLTDNGSNSTVSGTVMKVSLQNDTRIVTIQNEADGSLVNVKFGNIQSIG